MSYIDWYLWNFPQVSPDIPKEKRVNTSIISQKSMQIHSSPFKSRFHLNSIPFILVLHIYSRQEMQRVEVLSTSATSKRSRTLFLGTSNGYFDVETASLMRKMMITIDHS